MPPLPDWANEGAIIALARDVDESIDVVDKLRAGGAEIAAVWNQTWPGKATTRASVGTRNPGPLPGHSA